MILTDGKRVAKISMHTWDGNNLSPDFSNDFFDGGTLPFDEEAEVYSVVDVPYCIDQAQKWQKENEERNIIFIEEIEEKKEGK